MNIVSYWKNSRTIHQEADFTLIIGDYDHKNEHNGGKKQLGVHWDNYPNSHNVLCPCVIPKKSREAFLAGLLHQAVNDGDLSAISALTEAIAYFQDKTP